jgi:hypothetical protein
MVVRVGSSEEHFPRFIVQGLILPTDCPQKRGKPYSLLPGTAGV